jgi:LPS export ABC transporter protein LptC
MSIPTSTPAWLVLSLALTMGPSHAEATELRGEGMTFVGSSGSERRVELRSRQAIFLPARGIAELTDVDAEVSVLDEGISFTMQCDEAELDVETNDFLARGNVRGVTGGGHRYHAPWVKYLHEEGVLTTDAPVVMEDRSGSFRGDGFRYHIHEKRFRLLGNVRVEQTP